MAALQLQPPNHLQDRVPVPENCAVVISRTCEVGAGTAAMGLWGVPWAAVPTLCATARVHPQEKMHCHGGFTNSTPVLHVDQDTSCIFPKGRMEICPPCEEIPRNAPTVSVFPSEKQKSS